MSLVSINNFSLFSKHFSVFCCLVPIMSWVNDPRSHRMNSHKMSLSITSAFVKWKFYELISGQLIFNKYELVELWAHNSLWNESLVAVGLYDLQSASIAMMTSLNGNIFRVTGHMRGIPRSPVNSPHKGQWHAALIFSLICVWINGWVNNREAGDLRRYRAHYDVIVMALWQLVGLYVG